MAKFAKAEEFERSFSATHLGVWDAAAAKPKHSTTWRSKPLKRQLVDANGRALPGVQMKAGSAFNLEDDETHGAPARWPQPNAAVKSSGAVNIIGNTTKPLPKPEKHVCSRANCSCGK